MRLDKYLKVSRLIKRRTVANEVADAGRILINGKTAKAGLRHPASAALSLVSCWPLPQQLLPVSAAGGGRRRCPQRESHWQAGQLPTGRLRRNMA